MIVAGATFAILLRVLLMFSYIKLLFNAKVVGASAPAVKEFCLHFILEERQPKDKTAQRVVNEYIVALTEGEVGTRVFERIRA